MFLVPVFQVKAITGISMTLGKKIVMSHHISQLICICTRLSDILNWVQNRHPVTMLLQSKSSYVKWWEKSLTLIIHDGELAVVKCHLCDMGLFKSNYRLIFLTLHHFFPTYLSKYVKMGNNLLPWHNINIAQPEMMFFYLKSFNMVFRRHFHNFLQVISYKVVPILPQQRQPAVRFHPTWSFRQMTWSKLMVIVLLRPLVARCHDSKWFCHLSDIINLTAVTPSQVVW